MRRLKKVCVCFAIATLISVPLCVLANDKEEIEMLKKSTISLTEAIKLAEESVGGKAMSAEIDDNSFTPRFEVTVTKGGKVFDVVVDGEKGVVSGFREDLD